MIELKEIKKCFGKTDALHGVSFRMESGSIFGLVGSNGAGKSTLLRILSGVYRPDGGEALLNGENPWESGAARERLRFLPDEPWLPPQSSLETLGKRFSQFYAHWDGKYFERLCSLFPVDPKARYRALSKGSRRQAALILALSSRPDFLFLDEVFDGLDPVVRKLVKKLLAEEVAERRMTVVIASHNLRELEDFCDTLALLHKGGVLLEKELDDMKLGIHRVQCVFREMPPSAALKQKLCITSEERSGSLLSFVARGNEKDILESLDAFSPEFREIVPLSLEEVFISEMEAAGYDIENIL